MSAKKRNRLIGAMAIALGVCVFVIGDLAVRRAQALPDNTYKELQTFANVLAIVQKNYVEPVSTQELINGAITGMLASLDPHNEVGESYDVNGIPETFIIGRDGRIVAHHVGPYDWSNTDIREALQELIKSRQG